MNLAKALFPDHIEQVCIHSGRQLICSYDKSCHELILGCDDAAPISIGDKITVDGEELFVKKSASHEAITRFLLG